MEIELQNSNELSLLTDDRITTEILVYKNQVGQGIIEIGKRLIEMKKRIGHGNWLNYLANEIDIKSYIAERFIKIAREYSNSTTQSNLGYSKLYALLDVPNEEREQFIETKHEINGVEKTVDEMTTRELQRLIKEKQELQNQLINKETNINTLQFELQIERNKKPEIIERKIEVISESITNELKDKTNLLIQFQNDINRLKQENNSLQELKNKQLQIENLHNQIENLKREKSKVVKMMEDEVQIFKSINNVKAVIKNELLHIPTLIVNYNDTDVMKKEIINLVELLDNLKFAFKNKFGV